MNVKEYDDVLRHETFDGLTVREYVERHTPNVLALIDADIGEAKDEYTDKINDLDEDIERLEGERDTLEDRITDAQTHESNLDKQITELENKLYLSEEKATNLQQELDNLRNNLD